MTEEDVVRQTAALEGSSEVGALAADVVQEGRVVENQPIELHFDDLHRLPIAFLGDGPRWPVPNQVIAR